MDSLSGLFSSPHHQKLRDLMSSTHLEQSNEKLSSFYDGLDSELLTKILRRTVANHGDSIIGFHEHFDTCYTQSNYPKDYSFHVGKVLMGLVIISLMEDLTGSQINFERNLDICCGAGIIPATLKLLGAVNETIGVDIVDRRNDDLPDIPTLVERCIHDLSVYNKLDFCEKLMIKHLPVFLNQPIMSKSLASAMSEINLPTRKIASIEQYIDDYIVSDFIAAEIDGNFDFVSMYTGLDYFNVNNVFEKVSGLIRPGGYFFTATSHFWEMQGSTMHLPLLPWLHTCMSKERYLNFVEDLCGDEARRVADRMYYFGEQFVTSHRQEEYAKQNGFQPVYQRRVMWEGFSTPAFSSRYARYMNDSRPELNFTPLELDTHILVKVYQKQ